MEGLTRDQILQSEDLDVEALDIPEWGGQVYIRALSGTEREQYEKICSDRSDAKHFDPRGLRVKMVALSICDKAGNRLFGESDEAKLNAKSAVAIERIFTATKKINLLTDKDIVEMTKSLEQGPNENSGSD